MESNKVEPTAGDREAAEELIRQHLSGSNFVKYDAAEVGAAFHLLVPKVQAALSAARAKPYNCDIGEECLAEYYAARVKALEDAALETAVAGALVRDVIDKAEDGRLVITAALIERFRNAIDNFAALLAGEGKGEEVGSGE